MAPNVFPSAPSLEHRWRGATGSTSCFGTGSGSVPSLTTIATDSIFTTVSTSSRRIGGFARAATRSARGSAGLAKSTDSGCSCRVPTATINRSFLDFLSSAQAVSPPLCRLGAEPDNKGRQSCTFSKSPFCLESALNNIRTGRPLRTAINPCCWTGDRVQLVEDRVSRMNSVGLRTSPVEWHGTLSGSPDLCSAAKGVWSGALLRRWQGTASRMDQPPLDHHYLVLHLGGPKRVERCGLHSRTRFDVEAGAISVVTAGTSFSWTTEGPIGFAHLYLHPHTVDHVVNEVFDHDCRSVELIGCVGRRLPLLSAMIGGMLDELENPNFGSRLVLDTLLHSVIVGLLSGCSTLSGTSSPACHAISPRRLRRVLEFIESNLSADIELENLASVAGCSRFHFSRAFRFATGIPPYRYVIHRRINAAKALLLLDTLSISQISERCGFNSQTQFTAMFKRVLGTTPGRFRREH